MNVLVKNQRHSIFFLVLIYLQTAALGQSNPVYSTFLLSGSLTRNIFSFVGANQVHLKWKAGSSGIQCLWPVSVGVQSVAHISTSDDTLPQFHHASAHLDRKNVVKSGVGEIITDAVTANSFSQHGDSSNWQPLNSNSAAFQTQRAESDSSLPANGCGAMNLISAPTDPVTNDSLNTFDWTYSPGYESPELYEYTLEGGTLYQSVSSKPQPLGNNAYNAGQIGIRVKAGPHNYQSETLYSNVAYTVAPENLLRSSNFSFGYPFSQYNCTTNSTKNIPSPLSIPGTYYQSNLGGSIAEVWVNLLPLKLDETATFSMYIKPTNVDVLTLKARYTGSIAEATFTLSTGAISSVLNASGSVRAVTGYPGWYRVSLTYTSNTTTTDGKLQIYFPETISATNQKTFYLAGAQLNRGTTSGSFVPR